MIIFENGFRLFHNFVSRRREDIDELFSNDFESLFKFVDITTILFVNSSNHGVKVLPQRLET